MTTLEIIAAYEALRADYKVYAAESRACGYEVESFEHWSGTSSPKEEAAARWQYHFDNDTIDLY